MTQKLLFAIATNDIVGEIKNLHWIIENFSKGLHRYYLLALDMEHLLGARFNTWAKILRHVSHW
jgi:hypothetical protein